MFKSITNIRSNDFISSIVVFLVALPLCLGIAIASNAPISSGIMAGIIGGIVIGLLGSSQISVSGPAAGLTMIVAMSIKDLGSFPLLCAAILVAGILQILFGILKAGKIGDYFPSSVINGMLSAIGIILIMKQLPHAVGLDRAAMADVSFLEHEENSHIWSSILSGFEQSVDVIHLGAALLCLLSISFMLFWDKVAVKKVTSLKLIPSALLVVVLGILFSQMIFPAIGITFEAEHLVQIPYDGNWSSFFSSITFPDFSLLFTPLFWKISFTIAFVASLETLLSLDAATKIDPLKRSNDQNKELVAQGIGNFLCGLIGALPVTAVIVRTSANVASGGLYRWSAVLHGIWLLLIVNIAPNIIKMIPLASLAAILLLVGYKLTSIQVLKNVMAKGKDQFIPYFITIVAILFTDLLVGIIIGMVVGIIFIIKRDQVRCMLFTFIDDHYLLRFNKDISFLNKSELRKIFMSIPNNSKITIDGSRSVQIDIDIIETIEEFQLSCGSRKIEVVIMRSPLATHPYFKSPVFQTGTV
ncbi:MAG: SulP family inorganic anion transporter [Bacteriovoracaceae bacterium]|nr:SulP family inorganic anion transporter [Bacteriovoracaceae bacterium]